MFFFCCFRFFLLIWFYAFLLKERKKVFIEEDYFVKDEFIDEQPENQMFDSKKK